MYGQEKSRSPMAGCMAFQVRGCRLEDENIVPEILSHVGVKPGENGEFKDWVFYDGFAKDENLYNLDNLLCDEMAIEAAKADAFVVLVQDPLDAAKILESGTHNVISTFGPVLTDAQIDKIQEALEVLNINKVMVWFHREEGAAQEMAVEKLIKRGIRGGGLNWGVRYVDRRLGPRPIPDTLGRAVDFTTGQIAFVLNKARQQGKELDAKIKERGLER